MKKIFFLLTLLLCLAGQSEAQLPLIGSTSKEVQERLAGDKEYKNVMEGTETVYCSSLRSSMLHYWYFAPSPEGKKDVLYCNIYKAVFENSDLKLVTEKLEQDKSLKKVSDLTWVQEGKPKTQWKIKRENNKSYSLIVLPVK